MQDETGREICGYIKDNDEPCRLTAGWGTEHLGSGRCDYHPGPGGAPEGNDNAAGNSGGDGAPEGHFRNLETGDYTSADRWMEFLQDEKTPDGYYELFKLYGAELLEKGADETAASRIARQWTRADYNEMALIENDFETEHYYEGELVGMRFDSERAGFITKNERAARLKRREEELSPHSQQSSGTEVLIKGDSFDANISHERVASDDEDDSEDDNE